MADEVHVHNTTPPPPAGDGGGGGGGTNVLLVVVVLAVLGLVAWFMFMGGGADVADDAATEVNVEAPDIDVPDQVDVNVEQK